MKTKLLLSAVFSLAFMSSTFANHTRTSLSLMMFDGRPITVMVDGLPYGNMASQQEILNLTPGIHRLKIFAAPQYAFSWHTNALVPVFRGSVEVFDNYAVYATVNRLNQLVIEDYEALYCEPVSPPVPQQGFLPGYSPYAGTQHPNWNNGTQSSNCNLPGNENIPWGNQSGWNQGNYCLPMNQNDFNQLLGTIESKSFESTKQQIAMGALTNSYFTSEQIRQMLNAFTFESTKVEVAKKAYDRVVDPGKFYVVYNAFTFESSIDDLQASIR